MENVLNMKDIRDFEKITEDEAKSIFQELCKLNDEGTTIMMVTHDAKVAARCTRILYIVDGQIAGEYKFANNKLEQKEKERLLNTWLMDMGW